MIEHHSTPWTFLLVELGVGGAVGHAAHVAADIPPWIGGAASALVVGVALRLLDSPLKDLSERLRRRVAARLDARRAASSTANTKDAP